MTSRKKAGANCCVVGCMNNTLNSQDTRFYVFSRVYYKKVQMEKWIAAVDRKNPDGTPWEPKKSSRICSQHFIGNKKSDHPFSPSFVPTIFPQSHDYLQKVKNSVKSLKTRPTRCPVARPPDNPETSHMHLIQVSREPISKIELHSNYKSDSRILYRHQQTQVDFIEETIMDCKIFICNRFVNGSISEAEIQACFPCIRENLGNTSNRNIETYRETNSNYRDIATGPDSTNVHNNLSLKCHSSFRGFASIKNDRDMMNLGGVTLDTFDLLLKILRGSKRLEISQEDQLLIFLTKMKQDLAFTALSLLYNVERATISRAFYRTLKYLSRACKNIVAWPSREEVQSTMPAIFKRTHKNCRVIINCGEIEVEKPRTPEQRTVLYSDRRKTFTVKFLVGCTPSGLVSFVSRCYDGRTSNAKIASTCGFLKLLESDDIVLSANETPEIKSAITNTGKEMLLVIPRDGSNNSFCNETTKKTDIETCVRIQTTLTMQRIKSYGIVSKFTVNMLRYADDILFVCCVLANL